MSKFSQLSQNIPKLSHEKSGFKVFRMTPKAKELIVKFSYLTNRELEAKLREDIQEVVSYRTIGNFLNSEEFSQLSQNLSQNIPKLSDSLKDKVVLNSSPKPRKKKPQKELNSKQLAEFVQVISSLHVNAHPVQKAQIAKICGGHDILTVREWLISRYTEALTN